MSKYKVLTQNTYSENEFKIVPLRYNDRIKIMNWRNEQIYHLRQDKPLTEESQDRYFNKEILKLFKEDSPKQILFSLLKNDICIGYGGLVHINWKDRNAEISFIMNTDHQKKYFKFYWIQFLMLIQKVAFENLNLHKIYTYAFDLRPKLYEALDEAGFIEDSRLTDHCCHNKKFIDVVIHYKLNKLC
mgnify:CR=1 FL=1